MAIEHVRRPRDPRTAPLVALRKLMPLPDSDMDRKLLRRLRQREALK